METKENKLWLTKKGQRCLLKHGLTRISKETKESSMKKVLKTNITQFYIRPLVHYMVLPED